jgi:hypothetical protein
VSVICVPSFEKSSPTDYGWQLLPTQNTSNNMKFEPVRYIERLQHQQNTATDDKSSHAEVLKKLVIDTPDFV